MSLEHDLDSPLALAVRKAGSQSAFARLLGKRQSVVFGWLAKNKDLPGEHVLTVERELGISRHDLRPDLYPHEAHTVALGLKTPMRPPQSSIAGERLEGVRK